MKSDDELELLADQVDEIWRQMAERGKEDTEGDAIAAVCQGLIPDEFRRFMVIMETRLRYDICESAAFLKRFQTGKPAPGEADPG
jgi:hypothetical protein